MTRLSLFDPAFSDNFESTMRRFFAPTPFEAEAPALKMRIDGNVVQIDAEAKRETETKGEGGKVLRSERYYGTISRTFSLADDVDDAKAEAKYADGVLTLVLPKKATAASRKLAIH